MFITAVPFIMGPVRNSVLQHRVNATPVLQLRVNATLDLVEEVRRGFLFSSKSSWYGAKEMPKETY